MKKIIVATAIALSSVAAHATGYLGICGPLAAVIQRDVEARNAGTGSEAKAKAYVQKVATYRGNARALASIGETPESMADNMGIAIHALYNEPSLKSQATIDPAGYANMFMQICTNRAARYNSGY